MTETARLTVEWAQWGKEPGDDVGYRLLRHSDGVVRAETFDEMITRYSPGTPKTLPQITISWNRDRGNYIALAIYESPEPGAVDALGRDFIVCRCFCVPFGQLAAGHVSYWDLYEDLRQIELPKSHNKALQRTLPVPEPSATFDPLAARTAAMLLTCKPVCIQGAGTVAAADRLLILEEIMSLLPYGLRSRLSASTWVSGIFKEHKFRLFFSTGVRKVDYEIAWEPRNAYNPNRYSVETDYLQWVASKQDPTTRTSQLGTPVDEFDPRNVATIMNSLYQLSPRSAGLARRRRREQPLAIAPVTRPNVPAAGITVPAAGIMAARYPDLAEPQREEELLQDIEQLLRDCAHKMSGTDEGLIGYAVDRLLLHRNDLVTAEQRQRYQQVIQEEDLFAQGERLSPPLQDKLYHALLPLAFEMPLNYQGYCTLEAWLGVTTGEPMQPALARAIYESEASHPGLGDLGVRLLVLKGLGDKELIQAFRQDRDTVAELVQAAAAYRERLVRHARIVYTSVVRDLLDRPGDLDQPALRLILHRWDYLAPTLDKIHHSEPDLQRTELRRLLQLAYGRELDRPAIVNVLQNTSSAPTIDLLAAVLSMARPEDFELAERTFTRNAMSKRGYPLEVRDRALDALADNAAAQAEPGLQMAQPGRARIWNIQRRLRERRRARASSSPPPQLPAEYDLPAGSIRIQAARIQPESPEQAWQEVSRLREHGGRHAGAGAQVIGDGPAVARNFLVVIGIAITLVAACIGIIVYLISHVPAR